MGVVVHIEEEYGYRDWLWETNMTPDEVREFWKGIKSVNEYFFSGPTSFPGVVTQIYIERVYGEGWQVHQVPTEENPAQVFYWIYNEAGDSSANMSVPADAWSAHIHMECDSWLKPPGEEYVLHAGHVSDEEYFSDDYAPSEESTAAAEKSMVEFLDNLNNPETAHSVD